MDPNDDNFAIDDDFRNKGEWKGSDSSDFGGSHPKEEAKERPLGIKILTILLIINGIIALLALASGLTWDLDFFHRLIVGVAAIPTAYGFWKGLSWARKA
ncbi:MAG: hypothetical protein ACLFU5_02965, partial [Thermoplasmata archaeon]